MALMVCVNQIYIKLNYLHLVLILLCAAHLFLDKFVDLSLVSIGRHIEVMNK